MSDEFTEEKADELLNEIQPDGPTTSQIQDEPQKEPDYSWSFKAGDKELKYDWLKDREQIQKWAEHGYGATNKIASLNRQIEDFQKKDSQYQDMDKRYGPVDQYVKQNPKFWDHVIDSYQKRDQAMQDQSNPMAPVISNLEKKINEMSEFINQERTEKQKMRETQEDSAYTKELEELKKSYPTIDFFTPDETGKSLEYKVLEHAKKLGIGSFVPAFRDYHHDELRKIHEEGAKETVASQKLKNTRLGIIGTSETPVRQRRSDDMRGKSWADVEREAKEELGIT